MCVCVRACACAYVYTDLLYGHDGAPGVELGVSVVQMKQRRQELHLSHGQLSLQQVADDVTLQTDRI